MLCAMFYKCSISSRSIQLAIIRVFFSLQVNDIAFHPVHFCLLATVGSDGKFSFWDKDARTKLKVSTRHALG